MNLLWLGILSALGVLILFGSKRWAALGMVAGVLYLTQNLVLNVGGFSLFPIRVLALIAVLRIVVRREFSRSNLNRIDSALVLLYTYSVGIFLLRSDEGQVYQIGIAVDAFLLYFLFRTFIRTIEDSKWLLRAIVVLLVPYVLLLWIESITFQNPFAVIGGVELARAGDLWIREGRLRATGSFMHPSLLGTLGGVFLPLYMAMWFIRSERTVAVIGICLCIAIVLASNSGGPVVCIVAALVGWLVWPLRSSMWLIRRGLVAVLLILALTMKAPIWYLLAHISSVTGGDGFHRAILIDIAFQNLGKWWLVGMPLRETTGWLPYNNVYTGHVDITNTFLQFGPHFRPMCHVIAD